MAAEFVPKLAAAQDAYRAGKNEEAVEMFTQAMNLASDTMKANVQLSRARALYRLGQYGDALSDCAAALGSNDASLTCAASQLRGECFIKEDELEEALTSFRAAEAAARTQKNKDATRAFVQAVEEALAGTGVVAWEPLLRFSAAATAAERKFTPASPPSAPLPTVVGGKAEGAAAEAPPAASHGERTAAQRLAQAMARAGPSIRAEDIDAPFATHVPLEKPSKYRMQFNQNGGVVEVQVFAKKLHTPEHRDRVRVELTSSHLRIEILDEARVASEWTLEEELYQPIVEGESRWEVWSTQVNIKMKKVDGAIVWPTLGKSDAAPVPGGQCIVDPSKGPAHEYPSSHKAPAPRNWDALESEVKKEEKDEVLDGEAGLQKFFRQLYSGADEDTRRAMNKSFQMSGGTSLSTNWKDVSKEKFECKPPEGVKVKKFEY